MQNLRTISIRQAMENSPHLPLTTWRFLTTETKHWLTLLTLKLLPLPMAYRMIPKILGRRRYEKETPEHLFGTVTHYQEIRYWIMRTEMSIERTMELLRWKRITPTMEERAKEILRSLTVELKILRTMRDELRQRNSWIQSLQRDSPPPATK